MTSVSCDLEDGRDFVLVCTPRCFIGLYRLGRHKDFKVGGAVIESFITQRGRRRSLAGDGGQGGAAEECLLSEARDALRQLDGLEG